MKNNNKEKGAVGLIVVLVVLIVIVAAFMYQGKDKADVEMAQQQPQAPMGKVAAANVEDGEYYAQVESITSNPEDTTITFRHVMYFEGDTAVETAKKDGRPAEVRNGAYVRESGAPSFTAPLTSAASLTADDIRALMADPSYRPVFLVIIEDGAIAGISEVTKK